jgi:ribonuclease P/MRP protein subunit RPP1
MDSFYDLCVGIASEEFDETVELAKRLGWSGLGLLVKESQLPGLRKKAEDLKGENIDIALGVRLEPKRVNEVPKHARKVRRSVELVAVVGGDPEINRAALETPEVDILLSPWSEAGSGMNHVLARLGKKNNVAVCFGFNELVYSYKNTRARLLSGIEEAAKIVRKFNCPFILSSTAAAPWDMRSASELVSFGRTIGLRDPEIKRGLSGDIIEENRKRLSGKWIMPGVEVV